MEPYVKIVPPYAFIPISFYTGAASPVNMASLQHPLPKTTDPSVGTAPPGCIITKSLSSRSSTAISLNGKLKVKFLTSVSSMRFALVTLSEAKLLNYSTVFILEYDSMSFPPITMVIRIEAVSKLCTFP